MESKIKSSFIPKKPVVQTAAPANARYKSGGVDILMLIAIVALVISGVLSAGVFLYKNLAVSDAESKKEQLQKARGAFEPKLIEELMKLSDRIRVAEGILENHTAPSVFLQALEEDTLSGVQFVDFEYAQKSTDRATFALKGKTGSVNSVALQSSRFGESNIIRDPIFSDIDLVKDGVTFTVEGEIDLGAIRYSTIASLPQSTLSGGSFNLETLPEEIINESFGEFTEESNE
jgi:hypothetical protein